MLRADAPSISHVLRMQPHQGDKNFWWAGSNVLMWGGDHHTSAFEPTPVRGHHSPLSGAEMLCTPSLLAKTFQNKSTPPRRRQALS